MNIPVQAMLLPTEPYEKYGNNKMGVWNGLVKSLLNGEIALNNIWGKETAYSVESWQPQHLYIVDPKNSIKKGNCGLSKKGKTYIHTGQTIPSLGDRKVLATTNPRLYGYGIPLISPEFLKQYVACQGRCGIEIEMQEWCQYDFDGEYVGPIEPTIKLQDNYVVLHIVEKSIDQKIMDSSHDFGTKGKESTQTVDEAAEKYCRPWKQDGNGGLGYTTTKSDIAKTSFKDGWHANPNQFTQEDIEAAWDASKHNKRDALNEGITFWEWFEEYKKSKKDG